MCPEVPVEWNTLLKELTDRGLNAIIAGGAVRDLICGKKAKDIDIFVWKIGSGWDPSVGVGLGWHPSASPSGLRSSGFGHGKWSNLTGYSGRETSMSTSNISVNYVYEIKRAKWWWPFSRKLPLNLIYCSGVTELYDIIKAFDFGICQAAWDGKQFHFTPAFYHDVDNKCFSMMHSKRFWKSKERYARISKRYPGWELRFSGKAWLERALERLNEAGKPAKVDDGYW